MPGTRVPVRVGRRGARRVKAGHPWVFRDDVSDARGAGHGDLVAAETDRGESLGWAFYSARSKIALRFVTLSADEPDRAFWAERIARSLAWRARLRPDSGAARLVFGESDGIPGLVADRYGRHLVVQSLTAATERLLDLFVDLIEERTETDSVLARNDSAVRALEGLPREVRQLRGRTPPEIEFSEGGIVQRADCVHGQKTGAFLDQSENRIAASAWSGGRVLDAFCYQGGFALQAAARGAEVEAVDSSADAVARGAAAAAAAGLSSIRFSVANVFDDLRARERRGERFDQVILDPPAFAKSRAEAVEARRGYKEVNLRAMRLLGPDGVLVTSSCSYNLREPEFLDVLAEAAADAGRTFRVVEKRTQAGDHPIRLGFPESHYLKCLVLAVA